MMAAFCDVEVLPPGALLLAACARKRSMSASVRPAPKAPMRRKFRRERPSQNCWRAPRMVNMAGPLGRKEPGRQGAVGEDGGRYCPNPTLCLRQEQADFAVGEGRG